MPWGTAVNVQQMAFGNSGDRSGTGVAFTRDPATGEKKLMGEYLINAQGEERHNHVNRSWMRVNYNSDFTITVE